MRAEQETGHSPLVSVSEAANLAGLSKSVAYRLAAAGVLPGLVRLPGARLLVRRHVLEDWLLGLEDADVEGSAAETPAPLGPSALTKPSGDRAAAEVPARRQAR